MCLPRSYSFTSSVQLQVPFSQASAELSNTKSSSHHHRGTHHGLGERAAQRAARRRRTRFAGALLSGGTAAPRLPVDALRFKEDEERLDGCSMPTGSGAPPTDACICICEACSSGRGASTPRGTTGHAGRHGAPSGYDVRVTEEEEEEESARVLARSCVPCSSSSSLSSDCPPNWIS
eukprot:6350007-Prymnesium_polylepis.2